MTRAVKTGGPARFGPAHSGFGLHRAGLKSPDEKRARKSMARARPYFLRALSGRAKKPRC
ncbi:hypothetical protein JHK87_052043 [Glycine soja]|nr:hypothetical protein JHK87_052043 [Glycine soja]